MLTLLYVQDALGKYSESISVGLQKYKMSISVGLQTYKLSISVGVRGTEVLATTQTSDVNPGHGTNALIWGMT